MKSRSIAGVGAAAAAVADGADVVADTTGTGAAEAAAGVAAAGTSATVGAGISIVDIVIDTLDGGVGGAGVGPPDVEAAGVAVVGVAADGATNPGGGAATARGSSINSIGRSGNASLNGLPAAFVPLGATGPLGVATGPRDIRSEAFCICRVALAAFGGAELLPPEGTPLGLVALGAAPTVAELVGPPVVRALEGAAGIRLDPTVEVDALLATVLLLEGAAGARGLLTPSAALVRGVGAGSVAPNRISGSTSAAEARRAGTTPESGRASGTAGDAASAAGLD